MRTGNEKCDGSNSGSTDLGACNPECTGYYEKKLIKRTAGKYNGNLGGPAGADAKCRAEFGSAWKALLVGGGRRATVTALKGDGQTDWVIAKYTHYYNEFGQFMWRTDALQLLGVRNGQRMNIYANAITDDGVYPWGGFDSGWVTVPEDYNAPTGTCMGWSTPASGTWGTFPLGDLTVGSFEGCGKELPLLCVEQ